MAYGVYSEIYIALPFSNDVKAIKIGETTNARRRCRQLGRDVGFYVYHTLDVKGWDKTSRLMVENYLRGCIFQYLDNNSIHYRWVGLDYFYDLPQFAIEYIKSHFKEWVTEANSKL